MDLLVLRVHRVFGQRLQVLPAAKRADTANVERVNREVRAVPLAEHRPLRVRRFELAPLGDCPAVGPDDPLRDIEASAYLQDLFHAEETTESDWIWKRRLEKSRRYLADPLRAYDSIAQIALACGFADFGHFSRRYKDAFGASPREDRVALRTGSSIRGDVAV